MDQSVLLAVLFIPFVLMAGSILSLGTEYFDRFKLTVTEMIERCLSNQLLFMSASHLFWLYVASLVLIPLIFALLGVPLLFCLIALMAIGVAPRMGIHILASRRRTNIVNSLPDTLQQVSSALRAGATFNSAIQALVAERDEPIAQEFSLLLRELRLGISTDEALENLAERIKSEDMDIVVSAIQIAQSVGGDLAEVLTRLSDTLRSKISMEGRIKSLTAQGVMQGYVVTALPTVVMFALVLLEPKAIEPLFTSLLGWLFLSVILILQFCGGMFIRKIVNIDI